MSVFEVNHWVSGWGYSVAIKNEWEQSALSIFFSGETCFSLTNSGGVKLSAVWAAINQFNRVTRKSHFQDLYYNTINNFRCFVLVSFPGFPALKREY